jgi:hypothetical protein
MIKALRNWKVIPAHLEVISLKIWPSRDRRVRG